MREGILSTTFTTSSNGHDTNFLASCVQLGYTAISIWSIERDGRASSARYVSCFAKRQFSEHGTTLGAIGPKDKRKRALDAVERLTISGEGMDTP
jgi:hypothetical protein